MASYLACRAVARRAPKFASTLAALGMSGAVVGADAVEPLTLERAQQLALQSQPLLHAQAAAADAFRERAVSARQLPDPRLQTAVNEIPANGADAWSLSRDGDTDVMVGFVQEFPRAAKRRLRGERALLQASEADNALRELERRVRRDAGLAFLEAHHADRVAEIGERLVRESQLLRDSTELRLRSGLATQAELLAIALETSLLADRLAMHRQASARARRQLTRWIGEAADRPLTMPHTEGQVQIGRAHV